jgi:hypothetical protein
MLDNLTVAWIGIMLGFIAGAVQGLFFHGENWFGGYGSWRRRLLRLGHVAWFGMAFVNLAYAVTLNRLSGSELNPWPGWLFAAAAFLMPLNCYLAAWRKPLRHLFPIPVTLLLAGTIILFMEILS